MLYVMRFVCAVFIVICGSISASGLTPFERAKKPPQDVTNEFKIFLANRAKNISDAQRQKNASKSAVSSSANIEALK